jgi:hypothetical protein
MDLKNLLFCQLDVLFRMILVGRGVGVAIVIIVAMV